jgi:NAD(P)-dependent dehydrogenase (short-subunit alcohol dehydrogenase family)
MSLALTFDPGAMLVSGCGRVGAGVVRVLAQAGVPVLFTYNRDSARADDLVRAVEAAGGRVRARRMDLADTNSIKAALDDAASFGGGLRHIVSSGGPMMPFGPMAELDPKAVADFFDADAMGALRLAQTAIPYLRKDGGSISFCTTIANFRIVNLDGASPFSKGAVEALMRQIAYEEAKSKIRSNSVAVSWVSDLSKEEQFKDVSVAPEPQLTYINSLINQMYDGTPLERPALSDEAGYLFAFLASQQAAYLTGQTFRFDGGFALGGPENA